MIIARGISKSYGRQVVLENVSFDISAGQSAVIVGRNGTGKSTLLSIFAGFLRPDSGSVVTDGKPVAFCPQDDRLFEELTVGDNLNFWGRVSGGSGALARHFAQILGVDKFARKKIAHLSGGMKKSTAVCCALCGDPATLILDEPFAGLDIFHKNTLLAAFGQLKAAGKCILYSSHSIDEIVGLDSQIYTLANGQLSHFQSKASGIDILDGLLTKI
jgi:ABC-2 type transport system ATP-binding protein